MLTWYLDPESRVPLMDQLYTAIAGEIRSGRMEEGTKLPSKREMSTHLKISTSTVEAAFARLVEEGLCESRPRSGLYVLKSPEVDALRGAAQVPVKWNFSTSAVDAGTFPYDTWARLMREVLTERSERLLSGGDPMGDPGLRREIADMLRRSRAMEVSWENLVIGSGSEDLLGSMIPLLGREKPVAVEDPGYPRARRALIAGGARILPVQLLEGAVNPSELYIHGAGAAYVTPAHQFPTGRSMSREQKESLIRWAKETGSVLVEDDVDCEFRDGGPGTAPLETLSREHVIYLNTFTRTLAPGLRMGYMVLPDRLRRTYAESHLSCGVPAFEQETLRKFIASGQFERHVARTQTDFRHRLLAAARMVREMEIGEVLPSEAGGYLVVRAGGRLPAHQLVEAAAREGVRVHRLDEYRIQPVGEETRRHVLLGITGMREERIQEGLRSLAKAWLS